MSKNEGAKKAQNEVPSPEKVAEWILRDVQMCMSFLNMLRADPAVLQAIANTIHARHIEELEKKNAGPELEFSENGSRTDKQQ